MASQALQSTVSEVQSILRLVAASPEKYTGPVAQATPAQAEVRHGPRVCNMHDIILAVPAHM